MPINHFASRTSASTVRRTGGRRIGDARRKRLAFSLLELILALALSVMLFAAIAMAIQVYLVNIARHQALIERRQIARNLLTMVSNDLRSGIQYKAADYSGLDALLASQMMMGGNLKGSLLDTGSGNQSSNETTPSTNGNDNPSGTSKSNANLDAPDASSSSPFEVYSEDAVAFRPAILGNENVLMIDISRLPRIDQYNPLIASDADRMSSPSDVKSIAYFVSEAPSIAESTNEFGNASEHGGLYRREVDRAVASYLGDFQLVESPDNYSKLLAPEVSELRFRYFDGSDWQTTWDSTERGGFPVAVEVVVVIDPSQSASGGNGQSPGTDTDTLETYRSVVFLPVAEPVEEE